jgi:hypothetical protein
LENDDNQVFVEDVKRNWGEKLTEPLYMLIERVHQLHHASFSHKYSGIIEKFAYLFVKCVPSMCGNKKLNIDYTKVNQFVDQVIHSIDNLFSISFRDFELSQKDGMQIHSSGEILIALGRYVNKEMEIAKNLFLDLKYGEDNSTAVYALYPFHNIVMAKLQVDITVDTMPGLDTFINPSKYMKEFDDNRHLTWFNIVTIPPNMLYNLPITLFALSHEAGHMFVYPDITFENFAQKIVNEYDGKYRELRDLGTCKTIIEKFFHEFTADAFAARSLTMIENPEKSEEIFNKFIYEISPADEIGGIHSSLRKAAFREIILGLAVDNSNYGYKKNDNNERQGEDIGSTEESFPIALFETTLMTAKTFYEDYLFILNEVEQKNASYPLHRQLKERYLPAFGDSDAETELFIALLRNE